MSDYYPLIAKAIEGLSDKSPVVRRAVYERARNALVTHLRALDPPAPTADIDRERTALDLAISAVEAEYALPSQQTAIAVDPPHEPSRLLLDPIGTVTSASQQDAVSGADDPVSTIPVESEYPPAEIKGPERPRIGSKHHSSGHANRLRAIILVASILAVVVCIAGWKLYERQRVSLPPPDVAQQDESQDGASSETGKFAERLGGGVAVVPVPQASSGSPVTVAVQRSILFEPDPATAQLPMNQQKLIALAGMTRWSLEQGDTVAGRQPEAVVRADVDFPQAGLKLNMTIRKNTDGSAFSHLIELIFEAPDGAPEREVVAAATLEAKDNEEEASSTRFIGVTRSVMKNVFITGLSDIPADKERNIQLLRDKNWLDIKISFPNGRYGLISIEKGPTGFQVITDALRQW